MAVTIPLIFLFFTISIQRSVCLPLVEDSSAYGLANATSQTSQSTSVILTTHLQPIAADSGATGFQTYPVPSADPYSIIVTDTSTAAPGATGTQTISVEFTVTRPPATSVVSNGTSTSLSDTPTLAPTTFDAPPNGKSNSLLPLPSRGRLARYLQLLAHQHQLFSAKETLSPSTSIFTTVSFSVFTSAGHIRSTAVPVISTSVTMVPVPTQSSQAATKSKSSSLSTNVKVGVAVGGIAILLLLALVCIISRRRYLRSRAFIRLGEEL
ncbi:hypothetical protein FB451DRAFT_514338 [Mycena latifolia]|nr:hypothetical protein FB451DRAFT_514338 [Mycena latifolia]